MGGRTRRRVMLEAKPVKGNPAAGSVASIFLCGVAQCSRRGEVTGRAGVVIGVVRADCYGSLHIYSGTCEFICGPRSPRLRVVAADDASDPCWATRRLRQNAADILPAVSISYNGIPKDRPGLQLMIAWPRE